MASTDPASRCVEAFEQRFGAPPALLARAPGRVNLLGAHVDGEEGPVLPFAIEQAIWVAASPLPSRRLDLVALDLDAEAALDLDGLPPPVPARAAADGTWRDLPAGVAWVLERAGHRLPGLAAVYGGDLPMGAGVSSSAAVAVAFLLAWNRLAGLGLDAAALADLGRRMENDYLGVDSGLLDQTASLAGREGEAVLFDCRDRSLRPVPLPAEAAVLLVDSGVRRRLGSSGYNRRREECLEARRALAAVLPPGGTLRDLPRERLDEVLAPLPPALARRARHVAEECDRVWRGAAAAAAGDLPLLGGLMNASHASSRNLYEISTPELDLLAASAAAARGCFGARLMGGGFGGCVGALVTAGSAATVAAAAADAFRRRFGRPPGGSLLARPAAGAAIVATGAVSR